MRRQLLRVGAVGILLILIAQPAQAQDSHYWNLQYGTHAEFLSGSVVGSLMGLSSTYYNPGALALVDKPKLFTTSVAVEYSRVAVNEGTPSGEDLVWTGTSTAPTLVAGLFYHDTLSHRTLGYSLLTRQRFKFDIVQRAIDTMDVFSSVPGDEAFAGEIYLNQGADETWVGVTGSRRLSRKTGIGISPYFAYRSQRTRFQTLAQAASDSVGGTAAVVSDFSYYAVRVLAKIGVAWVFDSFVTGLTITTPGLNLFGSGKTFVNASYVGPDADNYLVSDYQEGRPASYRSPLSVAGGVSYRRGSTTFYGSAEWFDAVRYYVVMPTEPFAAQTTGDTLQQDLTHSARAVVNWGLGIQHRVREKLAFYAGFSADYSSFEGDRSNSVTVSTWDIYHISIGSEFSFRRIEFTLGAALAMGSNPIMIDYGRNDAGLPANALTGDPVPADVTYSRINVMVGFTLPI
jgi:hypothetical protein